MWLSSFSVAPLAWRWAFASPRCGSRRFRNGQRKQIIRTHHRLEIGSDYIGLVPVVGVEPTRVISTRDFESPSSAIPTHRRIARYIIPYSRPKIKRQSFSRPKSPWPGQTRPPHYPRILPPHLCPAVTDPGAVFRGQPPPGRRGAEFMDLFLVFSPQSFEKRTLQMMNKKLLYKGSIFVFARDSLLCGAPPAQATLK